MFNIYNTRRELDRLKLALNPAQVRERPQRAKPVWRRPTSIANFLLVSPFHNFLKKAILE